MTDFDLLLVIGYFRTATSYLSVVRHLSASYRIAVMPTSASRSLRSKTGEAEDLFISLCKSFGARIVTPDASMRARLMVVQQFPYPADVVDTVNRNVRAERRVGLLNLATAGRADHDTFLPAFGIGKVYVPSRRFMDFLVDRRGAGARYSGIEVEEVGLPFARYPVFEDFRADWLIAVPTLFSFSTEAGKQDFLETILRLLQQIPADDVVAYKPHNGNALDYFVPRLHYGLAAVASSLPGAESTLRTLSRKANGPVRRHASKTYTSMLHRRVLQRATPMSEITPYADMSLEAFLPGVRKGVIGGRSNTIWGTLYFDRPFYNCVDPKMVQIGRSEFVDKPSMALHDVNLQYFGVPFCAGNLAGGARGESIVRPEDRQGDLMRSLRLDLDSVE